MQSIGIDIGYSAVKLVLMDETAAVRFTGYRLHNGNPGSTLQGLMKEAAAGSPLSRIEWGAVTGSGGERFGCSAGIDRINEVRALVEGARTAAPGARAVLEIGGQGAKYVTGLDGHDRSRIGIAMSAGCAAGTGSFLEAQVARLGMVLEEYSALAARAAAVPRISGRCSVFAKTDITHHQQEGVPVADILMGLAYALVRNLRIAVLRKLPQQTPLLLAGGVARNRAIRFALQDLLKLAPDELIVPPEAACISALGAARIALNERMRVAHPSIAELKWAEAPAEAVPPGRPMPALASFGRGDNRLKHETVAPPDGRIDGYLGVDVGSTSTNLVLADPAGRIIAFRYLGPLRGPNRWAPTLPESFTGMKTSPAAWQSSKTRPPSACRTSIRMPRSVRPCSRPGDSPPRCCP